ncbi:MAG: hypothetical protein AAFY75_04180 [Pseudomonadota bacterium]
MTDTAKPETKRDRVRRLVIIPMTEFGMCRRPAKPKGETKAEANARADGQHRAFLDRVCDELGHMSDQQLSQMRRWLEVSGVGDKRNYWPDFATIAGTAHNFCPRPVEELPELKSWFLSAKGEQLQARPALLVAHLRFIQKFRHPPVKQRDVERIDAKVEALEAERRLALHLRDVDRPFDEQFLFDFDQDLARAQAMVDAGIAKRAVSEGAA